MQEHVDAAALNHVAGRAVHGAAVEGDPGQRRIPEVRCTGNCKLISNNSKPNLVSHNVS